MRKKDKPDRGGDQGHDPGVTSIPFIYFVYAGVIVLTYFYGWIVLAIFVGLVALAWAFAYIDDKRYAATTKDATEATPLHASTSETIEEDEYFDAQGNCAQCGSVPFSVKPGITSKQAIMNFAKSTKGWCDNPEALEGWMPPGIYCPNGCFGIHITPALNAGTPASIPNINPLPTPARIIFADVMRDGGSYALIYGSTQTELFKVELRVITAKNLQRIGYQNPLLKLIDAKTHETISGRTMEWHEADLLSKQLKPLIYSSSSIEGGGPERASEMLRYLSLSGGLS